MIISPRLKTLLYLPLSQSFGYQLIGFLNKALNLNLKVGFCVYAEERRFLDYFFFSWLAPYFQWRPTIVGYYTQGKVRGLILAATFFDPRGRELLKAAQDGRLKNLVDRLGLIRNQVGAERRALAGVLPSVCHRYNIPIPDVDVDATPLAVSTALAALLKILKINYESEDYSLIILGSEGFVASRVYGLIDEIISNIDRIDAKCSLPGDFDEAVIRNQGKSQIILNCTGRGELKKYFPDFNRYSLLRSKGEIDFFQVICDEVYPGLNEGDVQYLESVGVAYVRIGGIVVDKINPSFPDEYNAGGFVFPVGSEPINDIAEVFLREGVYMDKALILPCCAASTPGPDDPPLRVAIKLANMPKWLAKRLA